MSLLGWEEYEDSGFPKHCWLGQEITGQNECFCPHLPQEAVSSASWTSRSGMSFINSPRSWDYKSVFFSPLAGYMNSDPKRHSFQADRVIHGLKLKTLFMMLQGSSLTGKHHKFQWAEGMSKCLGVDEWSWNAASASRMQPLTSGAYFYDSRGKLPLTFSMVTTMLRDQTN